MFCALLSPTLCYWRPNDAIEMNDRDDGAFIEGVAPSSPGVSPDRNMREKWSAMTKNMGVD